MKKQFLLGLMAMLLPLTTWAQQLTVTLSSDSAPYSGTDQLETVKSGLKVEFEGMDTPLVVDKDYTVTFSQNGQTATEVKNAGIYTVTVTGMARTPYAYQDPVVKTFTIDKIALTLTKDNLELKKTTKPYGVTTLDVSEYVTLTSTHGVKTGNGEEADALACLSLETEYKTDKDDGVGSEEMLCLKANDESASKNYTFAGNLYFNVTIEKNELTATLSETTRVYDGEKTTEEQLKNMLQGVDLVKDELTLTVDGGKEIKNVGTYTINLALSDEAKKNYGIAETLTYEITRKPLTIKMAEGAEALSRPYNGEALTWEDDLDQYYQITGVVDNDNLDDLNVTIGVLDGQENEGAVGKYDVRAYVNGKQVGNSAMPKPAGLDNYSLEFENDGLKKFEITKKTVDYYFAGKSATYNGTEKTTLTAGTDYIVKVIGILDDDEEDVDVTEPTATFAENQTVLNVASYNLALDVAGSLSGKKADNYEFAETPLAVSSDATDAEKKVWNKFEIIKAKMTITAVNMSIAFDEEEPDEEALAERVKSNKTVSISGQPRVPADITVVRNNLIYLTIDEIAEAAEAEATEETEETVVSGKKRITVHLRDTGNYAEEYATVLGNYDFELNPGILTIEAVGELVLDGAEDVDEMEEGQETILEKLEKLDGATVNQVKIKNLQNIVYNNNILYPGIWYTLVLPFDVSVRDISSIFGYAIVNVPNYEKGSSSAASYSLTMGTVKANTLMLFKVDEQQTWDDTREKAFTNRKIVAPRGPETDNAGNKFIGVYEKTEIDQPNQQYLAWNGNFYSASAAPQTIFPLNGYIETVEKGARIFVEEADGSTTAINAITGEAITNAAEGWYTIGGVKLSSEPTEKGIYINNGVKVVIK